ncbi:MAG TPA: septal ring lytic transglycosylase RlpA family protein [Patescibacteria group bacterium]|nr:septal ring lytic transglycosylase RlpA family protein [Patescibacteria group bacterium]
MRKSTVIAICLLILTETTGIALPSVSWAGEGIYLDQKTIERGYPAKSQDGVVTLAIPPTALKKPIIVSITPAHDAIIPEHLTALTQAYDITLERDHKAIMLSSSIPLLISIPPTSSQSAIFLWNEPTREWLKLTTSKHTATILKTKIDFAELRIMAFSANTKTTSLPVRIALPKSIDTTEAHIITPPTTYTLMPSSLTDQIFFSDDKLFSVTIAPDSLLEPATLTIINKKNIYGPPAYRVFSSPLYEFDLKSISGTSPTPAHPLTLAYYGIEKSAQQKRINFLNQTIPAWEPIPTTRDVSANTVFAKINLTYAITAVFESTVTHEGKASWFSDALTKKTRFGAASNDYPMKTSLVVTNTENNKSVEVIVVSTGPFVPGRIIDLTKSAFSKLANPGVGIISITVSKKE